MTPAQAAPAALARGRAWWRRRSDRRLERRTLAGRVILLTTVAVGFAVTIVVAATYATARVQMYNTLDDSLLERTQAAASAGFVGEYSVTQKLPSWALGAADVQIIFLKVNGNRLNAYSVGDGSPLPQPDLPEYRVAMRQTGPSIRTITVDGIDYRVATVAGNQVGQALMVAQPMTATERTLAKLGIVALVVGALGVLVAAAAGWGVARNGLRPVRLLTAKAEEVARTEDLTPIPVQGDDEIARLSGAFNQMLLSLGASRDRQRRLVADAGHELRTPLTSLRTNLDLLDQARGSGMVLPEEARIELLDDVRAQVEELSTLVGDLVELARDEPLAQVIESVELTEVLDSAVARVRRRTPPGVEIEVRSEPWVVVGDPAAIERAYTNVLDNAVKWSPPEATVRVELARGVLTVDDEGPGIAEADRLRVFERFWRAEESRSMPGSGLGLSIVAQTAARHSGSVRADRSPAGGARLVLALPGDPAEPGER